MSREIIVNSAPFETRVAVVERRRLVELFIERGRERGVIGNIYKGRVTRVVAGLQAAFVDIGLAQAAYLRASDLRTIHANERPEHATERPRRALIPIEQRLKSGQELLVQIAKPPLGRKGARVTSVISLPGRHLVYTPSSSRIGISRHIVDVSERNRLKEILKAEAHCGGFIVRSACEGLPKGEIEDDARFLAQLWRRIVERAQQSKPGSVVHQDMDVVLRIVRDLFGEDTRRLIVDDRREYERICESLDTTSPNLRSRVLHYDDSQPIFERFGIEPQLEKALQRIVWLKSGGYVVIERGEALTIIDVNTGRFIGKRNHEDTIFETNLEAVHTIAEQIRLRNVGGLIVVDLIDMDDRRAADRVFASLEKALRRDRAVTKLLPISDLGLVEMSRKRTRPSLMDLLCDPCRVCGMAGRTKSAATIAYEIFRRIAAEAARCPHRSGLRVEAHADVVAYIRAQESEHLARLEAETGEGFTLVASSDRTFESYSVTLQLP